MEIDAPQQTFRVTVRGRFHQLDDAARRFLVVSQADHDIFKSSFTQEGTFTYDSRIDFFNFRYEVRAAGPAAQDDAVARAIDETGAFLRTMKIGHRDLRATVMDMSAMWDRAER